jgi:hypothetical protein
MREADGRHAELPIMFFYISVKCVFRIQKRIPVTVNSWDRRMNISNEAGTLLLPLHKHGQDAACHRKRRKTKRGDRQNSILPVLSDRISLSKLCINM